MTFGPELVIRAARERLAPILMTTLATALALVPLVVMGNVPGHEIEYPMAIVILGGLATSTLLNLFVVPSLYLRFGRSKDPRHKAIRTTRSCSRPRQSGQFQNWCQRSARHEIRVVIEHGAEVMRRPQQYCIKPGDVRRAAATPNVIERASEALD